MPGRGIVSKTMVIIVRGDVEFIPFQIGDEASEEPLGHRVQFELRRCSSQHCVAIWRDLDRVLRCPFPID